MKKKYQGSMGAKRQQLRALRSEFETLRIKSGELVSDYFSRVVTVVNKMRIHGDKSNEFTIVEKILWTMTPKFNFVVCSIEESHDIDLLSIAELQNSLFIHEQKFTQQEKEEVALNASTDDRSGGQEYNIGNGKGRGKGRGRGYSGNHQQRQHYDNQGRRKGRDSVKFGNNSKVAAMGKGQTRLLSIGQLQEKGVLANCRGRDQHSGGRRNFDECSKGRIGRKKLKDLKAKNYLFQAIYRPILEAILCKETSKDTWDSTKKKYQVTARVKGGAHPQALRRDFETLQIKKGESVMSYCTRTMEINNKMRFHGQKMNDVIIVEKIVRSLTPKYNYVIFSIEESKDIDELSLDELQSSLLVHEQKMNRNSTSEEQALKASTFISSNYRGRGRGRRRGRGRGDRGN
ncbi:hypothetical protein KY284_010924 [Solanum tuberosum]|nr:hypothetical protein KY284_010924 [Solanum tuberosum]